MKSRYKRLTHSFTKHLFQIMNTRIFFSALFIVALFATVFSCTKPADEILDKRVEPTVPEGSRIKIHFGTSTYRGCLYSFSNCIWIGWGDATPENQHKLAFLFNQGDQVSAEYGNFFPLTAAFTLPAQNGEPAQVFEPGFYRFINSPDGRKRIVFDPAFLQPVAALVNPNNPQDNLGQLHNLAMQAIYTNDTRAAVKALNDEPKAVRKMLSTECVQFLDKEAGVKIESVEQKQIENAAFTTDFAEHRSWIAQSALSENDRNILMDVMEVASSLPVSTPEQLSAFVKVMTDIENALVQNPALDDRKMLLSAVSIAKYSRYYWFWKTYGNDAGDIAQVADWWKADVKGFIQGGLGQAIVDSLTAAFF